MMVSVVGPLSNLLLAILAALPFRAGWLTPSSVSGSLLASLSAFLVEFIFINLLLLFFNLIPLSPLDGEKVLEYLLPPEGKDVLARLRPYGPMILLALVFLGTASRLNLLAILVQAPAARLLSLLVL
jgi:Zn-dependent protease